MADSSIRVQVPGPRAKRHKIDVACDTCRSRKVKCDGVRPSCGNCLKRLETRNTCKYSANPIEKVSRPTLQPTVSPVISRPDAPSGVPTVASGEVPRRPNLHRPASSSIPGHSPDYGGARSNVDLRSRHGGPADPSPSLIDSMTTVVEDGVNTHQYFGSSSAGSFTKQIKAAIDARLGEPPARAQLDTTSAAFNRPASDALNIEDDPDYVLPPRRQADHLMNVYWYYVDTLYPFLDRDKWNRSYEGLFAGTHIEAPERIFVTTLNVILALSTQLLESLRPEQREDSSNVYFRRAQNLLRLNLWEPGSVELIQCLLLMSQYLQSTNNPHQTWMVVGSAIRIAQSLGLHLPETTANLHNIQERELLRTIWHGCVLMDRMVSVTHGRPAMISDTLAAAVPLPLSSMQQSSHRMELSDGIVRASFFVKSVELYEIINLIVLAFYSETPHGRSNTSGTNTPRQPDRVGEDLGTVMKLDESLSSWEAGLPHHLRFDMLENTPNDICKRQAVILQIRFLQGRILLLRPTMAQYCLEQITPEADRVVDNLRTRVIRQCAALCVSTAQRVISILAQYQTQDGTVGLLPAWWYRVYYVYSAATILIVAKLRPDVIPLSDIQRSWDEAMSILRSHETFGQSAQRCVAALEILSFKILQNTHHTATPNDDISTSHSMSLDTAPMHQEHANLPPTDLPDFPALDLNSFAFDTNFLSWLNVNAWELLNEP